MLIHTNSHGAPGLRKKICAGSGEAYAVKT